MRAGNLMGLLGRTVRGGPAEDVYHAGSHDCDAGRVRPRAPTTGWLTLEDLAERAGTTVDTVGALERGLRRRLYPHTARAIADALALSELDRAELTELARGPIRAANANAPAEPVPRDASPSAAEPPRPAAALHNLPALLTSLIGRDAEMAQIKARMAQSRLLTLTGAGGIARPAWPWRPRTLCVLPTPMAYGWWTWRRSAIGRCWPLPSRTFWGAGIAGGGATHDAHRRTG